MKATATKRSTAKGQGKRSVVVEIGLGELSKIPGVPSVPTLTKLIENNPDFPVIEIGGRGKSWRFDQAKAVGWLDDRAKKKKKKKAQRHTEIKQAGMDLFGFEPEDKDGLSTDDRIKLVDFAQKSLRLRKDKGELVEVHKVSEVLNELVQMFSKDMRSIPDQLARLLDIDPDIRNALRDSIDRSLNDLADRIERVGKNVATKK